MSESTQQIVQSALQAHQDMPGSLLPILHAIQDALGYVPPDALPPIAKALHLSRAEVHGVVSFYPHFRTTPPGKHVIRVCRAESCQAMGADELAAYACHSLGVEMHATTADGLITVEPVYCLGNCACSPALMIDDDVHGRVTSARFDALVAGLAEAS